MNKEDKKNIYSQNQVPYQAIADLFNEILQELPTVQLVTDTRKKHLKARWNTSDKTASLEWWKAFFENIRDSDFLMGKKSDKFQASFDWIIKSTNFIKIIEGNYHKCCVLFPAPEKSGTGWVKNKVYGEKETDSTAGKI